MSNKLRLQTNNTDLQELIDKARALPDAGGSSNSIEWQDVSALPRTYVVANIPISYYIEIPTNFKMIAVRCLISNNYYSANAVVMNNGGIVIQSNNSSYCKVSVLNDENVICITIADGFTAAEYLIV